MNPRRKKRLLITSSLIAGLSLAIGLTLYALQQNIDLFYTPNEILNGKNETGIKPEIGQRLRVGGMVLNGSVQRDPESLLRAGHFWCDGQAHSFLLSRFVEV